MESSGRNRLTDTGSDPFAKYIAQLQDDVEWESVDKMTEEQRIEYAKKLLDKHGYHVTTKSAIDYQNEKSFDSNREIENWSIRFEICKSFSTVCAALALNQRQYINQSILTSMMSMIMRKNLMALA